MKRIILIRHGQASFGAADYDRLSEIGRKQAEMTGRFLENAKITLDAVYSGSQRRQTETAEIAMQTLQTAGRPNIRFTPDFDEYDFMGVFRAYLPEVMDGSGDSRERNVQFSTDSERFRRYFGKVMKRWALDGKNRSGLESLHQFVERIQAGLDTVISEQPEAEAVGIFTSGGVIAVTVHLSTGIPPWEALKLGWNIANGSVSSLIHDTKGFRMESFNCTGHLRETDPETYITYR